MPADLKDPEGFQPFYYDPRYEEPKNPFEIGAPDTDGYLQSIVVQELGHKLDTEKLNELKVYLESKGFFHRNTADESFRNEVKNWVKIIKMARRILNARSK